MDFHALEGMQCMLERRRGGETGVRSVHKIEGDAVWNVGWSKDLLSAALSRSDTPLGLTVKDGRTQDLVASGELRRLVLKPFAYLIEEPSWFFGQSKANWQPITSAGVGVPEPLKDGGLGLGNIWIVRDLLDAIEKDRQPLGSVYDGRAALEMILAVYESHRLRGPVDLPLKNRRHPLTLI